MTDIKCYLCERNLHGVVCVRGGQRLCKLCADRLDQKNKERMKHPDFFRGHHGGHIFYNPVPLDVFYTVLDTPIYHDNTMYDDLIVCIRYKYNHEIDYTEQNEILTHEWNPDQWVWLNDWNEGQQQVYVVGWIGLSELSIF